MNSRFPELAYLSNFIRGDTFSKGVTSGALKGPTSGVLQSVSSKKLQDFKTG